MSFFFFFLPSLYYSRFPLLDLCLLSLSLSEPAVSSLERSSPLPEGRSRSLRSNRPFGGSSVTVVKMTPLSFLPGTRIIKYLGIINMFFIRETTSLREVRLQQGVWCPCRPSRLISCRVWTHLDMWHVCLSSAGRWRQWLSALIHSRGVRNGPSSCSSPGGQRSGVLQHERVCVYGESKQEPGIQTHTSLKYLPIVVYT